MVTPTPRLMVMLTHHDRTVKGALEVFTRCQDTPATHWGLKEEGLPLADMRRLYSLMKECGKVTILEVVACSEEESLRGARLAVDCGVDILMGTLFRDSTARVCAAHGITYLPFVGSVSGRPSILEGSIEALVEQAGDYLAAGAFGFDLLAYRYDGDPAALITQFMAEVKAPVCIAGSINSYARLDQIKLAGAWACTIGGAFFEHKFGGSIEQQITDVCAYLERDASQRPPVAPAVVQALLPD